MTTADQPLGAIRGQMNGANTQVLTAAARRRSRGHRRDRHQLAVARLDRHTVRDVRERRHDDERPPHDIDDWRRVIARAGARIFNDQTANGNGTFGEDVPALTRSRALSQGVLLGLSDSVTGNSTLVNSRTNLGLFNPNDTDTTVDLELRDDSGNVVASKVVTLPAMTLSQIPLAGANGGS